MPTSVNLALSFFVVTIFMTEHENNNKFLDPVLFSVAFHQLLMQLPRTSVNSIKTTFGLQMSLSCWTYKRNCLFSFSFRGFINHLCSFCGHQWFLLGFFWPTSFPFPVGCTTNITSFLFTFLLNSLLLLAIITLTLHE